MASQEWWCLNNYRPAEDMACASRDWTGALSPPTGTGPDPVLPQGLCQTAAGRSCAGPAPGEPGPGGILSALDVLLMFQRVGLFRALRPRSSHVWAGSFLLKVRTDAGHVCLRPLGAPDPGAPAPSPSDSVTI